MYVCNQKPMRLSIVLFTATCFGVALHGQMPPGATSSGPSRAAQLPLSENVGGSVTTQQAVNPGSGPATVTSSVTVSGSYAGSVAPRTFPEGPIRVGLADAVRRGLETNLGSTTATNQVAIARSERLQSLSAMLPDISASASETVTQVNLAAYGLTLKLPSSITGFSFPTVVGPYEYSQLQGTLSQSIFDLVQRRNYKASKESERAAVLSGHDARELVVLAVAGTYLQALASEAQVASERAQVANAQAVYDQAVVRKAAGTNARIDVTRSLVELQTEQQRLTSLEADLRKQKITLARLAGLPLGHQLILTDAFTLDEIPVPSPEQAIEKALNTRWDLKATEAQVRAAELVVSAAKAERLPYATLNGNYGAIGPRPDSAHGVFGVTGSVNVPLYTGGRIKADIQQAETTLKQRQSELADARGRVEGEVRTALIELETAVNQLKVAATNRDYARETLTEARDRFEAGVATTVEVVQAQEQVATAEADYVSTLFSYNLAKLTLARATGDAENGLPELLGGNRP